jgi:hypothetical protein
MEMNFPHHDVPIGIIDRACDFRVLIAEAINRQGNSATARAMLLQAHAVCTDNNHEADFLDKRIQFFAACTTLKNHKSAPHGAFYLLNRGKNNGETNYEDAVYQVASANIKLGHLISELSADQAIQVGQEN